MRNLLKSNHKNKKLINFLTVSELMFFSFHMDRKGTDTMQSRHDNNIQARSKDKRRSRSRERRKRTRSRSRGRSRRSRSRERHRAHNSRSVNRRRSPRRPSADQKSDNDIRRGPLNRSEQLQPSNPAEFDARNYVDPGEFEAAIKSKDWKKEYDFEPNLDQFRFYKSCLNEMPPDILKPFQRLYGRKPSLDDFVLFEKRRRSRNWLQLCNRNPTFEDYVVFAGHKGLPSWMEVSKVLDREPMFQDFMQYAAMRFDKNWTERGLRVPSFEDFMYYMVEIQKHDWRKAIKRVPGFTDYVTYLDRMSSDEWATLSVKKPDFMSYMAFKEGLPPPPEEE